MIFVVVESSNVFGVFLIFFDEIMMLVFFELFRLLWRRMVYMKFIIVDVIFVFVVFSEF